MNKRYKSCTQSIPIQSIFYCYVYPSIFIVRPSMKSDDISLYETYLDCDQQGNVQNFNPQGDAAHTLFLLLENYLCSDADNLPLILLGFSRGALVLNQLLSELGTSIYSDSLLSRFREIHWLDCGNGVNNLCYPVLSDTILSSLQPYRHSLRFYFHTTSYLYQEDPVSTSYSQLLALFDQLQQYGITVWKHFYQDEFSKYGQLTALQQHFSLLYEFYPYIVFNKNVTLFQRPLLQSPSP